MSRSICFSFFILVQAISALGADSSQFSSSFQALIHLAMPSMSDSELAQVEGHAAQIITTTFFGADAMIVVTPAGVINGTAQGAVFASGDTAELTRSTVIVDGIAFTGQTVVTPSGQLNSFGQVSP